MALRKFLCKDCGTIDVFFDHERDKVCPKCLCSNLERQISMPLAAKITDKVDKYHNVDMVKGVDEDLRSRSRRHSLDTIDDFISEHGEQQAKEVGLLITEDNGRTWRKKTIFDEGLLNTENSGSRIKK